MINIILTSTTEYLAKNLSQKSGNFKFIIPEKNKEGQRYFSDSEVYMRIPRVHNLRGNRVIVLHSGAPKPNDGLVELELILQILKDYQIKPEVFFTYFPYSRQDKAFKNGETNAAENLIKKIINYYKVRKIYAIDPHFEKMKWLRRYPVCGISAVPLLVKKVKENFGHNFLLLTPDKGGKRRTGIAGLNKKRINSFKVKISPLKIPLKGKTIAVVDDIIGSGSTLLGFYEFAKKSGAKKVIALVTHGVLDGGIKKIKKTFGKLYLANTINKKDTNVDITDLIIRQLKTT